MNLELVRINSIDGIEQPGILYTPDEVTEKIVIHVHGLDGNFYENRFIDKLAESCVEKKYAFLTFNNRGRDFDTELLKGNEVVYIGATKERFKDCILDIEGVLNWVKERGYKEIVLEGHSYGCNKILYYYSNKKDHSIKKLILLSPCDVISAVVQGLSEEKKEEIKKELPKLIREKKENETVDFAVIPNMTAGTFCDYLPGGENDIIRYADGEDGKSEILNSIDIPTLVIFGDNDDVVLTQPIYVVKKYLSNNLMNCNIQVIEGADHLFTDKYDELGTIVKDNIF